MPINYALASNGSSATATNFLASGFEPSNAIDGTLGAYYHSATQSSITLEIDLGQNRTFNQVKIRTSRTDSGYQFGYSLDYWNGSTWVNIVTGQSTTNGVGLDYTHNFSDVTGSKVRMVTTGADYTTVTEFEVNGEPPVPPTCDVVNYSLTIQDIDALIGIIAQCDVVNYSLAIQDIEVVIAEVPVDFAPFEILEHCRMLNISGLGWGAPLVEANFGGGHGAGIIANQDYGLHRWQIGSEFLPDKTDFQLTVDIDGGTVTQNYFTYIFEFFKRHTLRGNKPFVIKESRTDLYYLVRFAMQGNIDFGRITAKFFTSEGIAVEEARTTIAGFTFAENGSVTKDA
jgi:hypothetical protein